MVTSKSETTPVHPIIIDLGRTSRRQVKKLKQGKGPLVDLIQSEEHASFQTEGTPIYLVARKEKKTKTKIEKKAKKWVRGMFKSRGRNIENESDLVKLIWLG